MSTTQPNAIFETGRGHVKPLLTAIGIFVAAVLVALIFTGLP